MFGKKVVCTVHGLDWQREKWGKVAKKALKLGELATAKFPHKTISVSESISNYYNETYNNDTIFVPNGIDEKISIEANEIIEKYGLQKDEYILFLARLVPEKGVHYLIEAYNKLNTNKKLVIAGGSSHSDDYVNKVNEMAKENPNIIMTGFVNGNLLEELFSNAYMYELPSREDVTECIITKDVITGEGEPKLLAAGKEVPALEEKQEEPEKKESESA